VLQNSYAAGMIKLPVGSPSSSRIRVLGRYALHGEIAHGGMATVHLGRLLGVVGFAKTVAIKRLHPQFAKDPEFVSMFLDEARLAARIRHPNVVSTLDVVAIEGELFLVMEYVHGESLLGLLREAEKQGTRVPPDVVASVMVGALHGLHAAHEAKSERGEPLGIVHRDVSPQNILVGSDGVARVLDFGVAKATGRVQKTRDGQLKGKFAYMSPEQLGGSVTRATDIWAASVVLWEALVGLRLFGGASEGETVKRVLDQPIEPPSKFVPGLPAKLDELTLRGLQRNPMDRFASAREMAKELERVLPLAPTSEVGDFVEKLVGPALAERAERVEKIESSGPSNIGRASAANLPVAGADDRSEARASPTLEQHTETTVATVKDSLPQPPIGSETHARTRRTPQRVVASVVGLSAAALLVAIGLAIGARRSPDGTHAASSSVPLEQPPGAPSSAPVTSAQTATASPVDTTPAPAVVSAAPAEAAIPPAPAVKPPSPSAPAPRPVSNTRAKPPQNPKPKPTCNPPFTLDAAGDKHFKPECY
jgi:serine/threonine-protein kinase